MQERLDNRFSLWIDRRWEIPVFLVLFALAVFLRFYHLSADPPYQLGISTGLETDPPQYTLFARNDVQTGDWNPYHDDRYPTYEYSLVSGLGWIVFKSLGVGLYQSNLVGVILSLLSLLLFYFVIRRALGNGTALLMLLFLATNSILIFHGRRPFLENGMILALILGLFCVTYLEKRFVGHFQFGEAFGLALFFGKLIAVAFLAVPLAYYGYHLAVLKTPRTVRHFLLMLAGLGIVWVGWFLIIFLPRSRSVAGYVGEQVFGLYGAPEGFQSFLQFVWKFLSFGTSETFYEYMPIVSIAALVYLLIIVSRTFFRAGDKRPERYGNAVMVAIIVWLVATYVALAPWNYQPLRYQTVMIYPVCALAAALIVYLYNAGKQVAILNRSPIFILVFFVSLLMLTYQFSRAYAVARTGDFFFLDNILRVTIIAGALTLAYYFLALVTKGINISFSRIFRYGIIVIIAGVSVGYQADKYLSWAKMPLFTARQASKDLGMILSPTAVIAGPYGPALAMENKLGCIIHFFGTSRPDPGLFRRFPITHLLVDLPNEKVARRVYPGLLDSATVLHTYHINGREVKLYRIAEHTGNRRAAGYQPTRYEQAVDYEKSGFPDSARVYLTRFLKKFPQSIAGNVRAAIYALQTNRFDAAIRYCANGLGFSYTDFNLHFLLGNAYIGKSIRTNDRSLYRIGKQEIELANKYCFGTMDVADYMFRTPEDSDNGTFEPAN